MGKINNHLQKTPVAIIGMAAIFADAKNLEEYWKNIVVGKDCITDVPPSRWKIDDYYDPDPMAADKTFCKRGGFIPDVDFNPMEFGLPPNILEVTDVAQLLALLVARDALRDAGYCDETSFRQAVRDRTGVILGVGGGQKLITPLTTRLQVPVLEKVLRSSGLSDEDIQNIIGKFKKAYIDWNENSFPGMLGNVIAGRITNRFDLGGTNCVVDAACAASLSAIKMAVSELIEGRCDMVLTGGVDADNSPFMYMSFSKTPAFSKKGMSRPFDEEADGMLIGEGVGMLVCKRLEDAEQDGDRIYAVIKGIGSSSDGRASSIYAPRPSGQVLAIKRTYEEAGYSPSTVGLVEAHGTGTIVGDPTEFESMATVFCKNGVDGQHIALGSVKSQIGHTKTSAGVAGMIKSALALHHKVLPGTINVTKPNPKFNIESSQFYLNTETRPWIRAKEGVPRRASTSAFGFGGVNVHVALEEYEIEHNNGSYRLHNTSESIILHAETPDQLLNICKDIIPKLQSDEGEKHYIDLIEDSRKAVIPESSARLGFVCDSIKKAIELLSTSAETLKSKQAQEIWEHPQGIYYRAKGMSSNNKVVALFSGQGSQYVNMGKALACSFPPVRQAFADADSLFIKDGLQPLSKVIFPIPTFDKEQTDNQKKSLTQTENAQPAIGAFSVGLYKLLEQAGFKPDFIAGHSFGELTALWAAGVYDDEAFMSLAKSRGQAMMPPKDDPDFDAGSMLAVKGDVSEISEKVKQFSEIKVANINSNNQVVLGGATKAIREVQSALQEEGFSVIPLPVSAAFHTSLVNHAQKPFAKAIRNTVFNKPKTKVYSNTTAKPYPEDVEGIKVILQEHILNSVRFKEEIENIHKAGGRIFVEFGPKGVLTNLVKDILKEKPHLAIALNANCKKDSDYQLRETVVRLTVAGLDLKGFDPYRAKVKKQEERKNKMLNVPLNGSNYVSEKTQKAFEDSLKDGYQIQKTKEVVKTVEVPAAPTPEPVKDSEPATAPDITEILDNLTLGQIADYFRNKIFNNSAEITANKQKATESVAPSAFATAPAPKVETVTQVAPAPQVETVPAASAAPSLSEEVLSQSLLEIVSEKTGYPVEMIELEMNMEADLGIDSIKRVEIFGAMQEKYPSITGVDPKEMAELQTLAEVVGYVKSKTGESTDVSPKVETVTQVAPAPQVETVPAASAAPSLSEEVLSQSLLEIVSEKTGYPVEMIELEMNMEADLGIDSIKRVEIFGAMQEKYPSITGVDPKEMAELQTLAEVVGYVKSKTGESTEAAPKVETVTQVAAAPAAPSLSEEVLSQSLLEIVSEKTGYPVEMIELEMNMEADLGIDSIKRVEIFGAMQEKYPSITGVDPKEMAELQTLAEVVGYVKSKTGENTEAAPKVETVTQVAAAPAPQVQTVPAAPAAPSLSEEVLSHSLLEIVSEKTGYPVEMIELEMNMEADLGIDSIKRVEIFGAMQEKYPSITGVDPKEMAELQTLAEVVGYVKSKTGESTEAAPPQVETVADASIEADQKVKRSEVRLKYLPFPDFMEIVFPEDYISLLVNDGSALTESVAELLLKRGQKVVVLTLPENLVARKNTLPDKVKNIVLESTSDESIKSALDGIKNIGSFIHLHPHFEIADGDFSQFFEREKAIIKTVFLLAKHLKQPLDKSGEISRACFMTVCHLDGEFGLGNNAKTSPICGGLFGLTKTLNLEWQKIFCRAVDLQPELDLKKSAEYILSEMHDPDSKILEVGYTKKGRQTLVVEKVNINKNLQKSEITPSSVFLVSGGGKGVTAECAIKLAEAYKCKFILLGRSSNEGSEPDWAKGCNDERQLKELIMQGLKSRGEKPTLAGIQKTYSDIIANREIKNTLQAIKKAGGEALYLSADVTDTSFLKKILPKAVKQLGEITGIIHGAGRLADKLIEDKTEADFESVYSVKTEGLLALLDCVSIDDLKHLVLFSSVAGFYGNVGQSDYAIANETLNKIAHFIKKNHPSCHVSSINWGPWDSGMVRPELKKLFEENNIELIPTDAGASMLVDEMRTAYRDQAQVVIGNALPLKESYIDRYLKTYRIHRKLTLEANPFLNDHTIGEHAVIPVVSAVGWISNACEQIYPDFKVFSCADNKLLKGIVFDGKNADSYILDLKEIKKCKEEIVFEGLIWSNGSNGSTGKRIFHYSAIIKLLKSIPEAPVYKNKTNGVNGTSVIPVDELYRDGTLFHGPAFRGIKNVKSITSEKIVLECQLPHVSEEVQGQFPTQTINTLPTDLQYQAMLVWVKHFQKAASLPLKTEQATFYKPIPFDKKFYVSVDVKDSNDYKMIADIATYDENDELYVHTQGAEVTLMQKGDAMKKHGS